MLIYFLFFFIISFLSLLEAFGQKGRLNFFYWFICLLLICLVGFRGVGVSRDDLNYVNAFSDITDYADYFVNYQYWSFFEPLFYYLVFIIKHFISQASLVIFFSFALIAGLIKFKILQDESRYLFVSLLVYFTFFLFLHDMTQIRASLAIAFFLLGLQSKDGGNRKLAVIYAAISIGFHYSAIMTIPVYFLNNSKINRNKYLILIISGFIFYFVGFNFNQLIIDLQIPAISDKFVSYRTAAELGLIEETHSINVFNKVFLLRLVISSILLLNIHKVKDGLIFLKMYFSSIFVFLLLGRDTSGIAYRITEVLGVSEVFVLPLLIDVFKQKIVGYVFVVGFCFISFINGLFFEKLVNPYFLNNFFYSNNVWGE